MSNQLELFHNTTCLEGSELRRREIKAGSQNQKILAIFRNNPDEHYTPFEIWAVHYPHAPLTSIRRAMTDLTKLGYLEKTKEKRAGEYGTDNYLWKLKQ